MKWRDCNSCVGIYAFKLHEPTVNQLCFLSSCSIIDAQYKNKYVKGVQGFLIVVISQQTNPPCVLNVLFTP